MFLYYSEQNKENIFFKAEKLDMYLLQKMYALLKIFFFSQNIVINK